MGAPWITLAETKLPSILGSKSNFIENLTGVLNLSINVRIIVSMPKTAIAVT